MIRETLVLMWHHCDDVYMILMRFVLMWLYYQFLTHCDRTTHGCDGYLTIIDSDNGFSPGRRQAIIWTDAGILLIGPLGTNFGESLVEIHTFSFKQMHLKMSSRKWRQFFSRRQCVAGFNVIRLPYSSGLLYYPKVYIISDKRLQASSKCRLEPNEKLLERKKSEFLDIYLWSLKMALRLIRTRVYLTTSTNHSFRGGLLL